VSKVLKLFKYATKVVKITKKYFFNKENEPEERVSTMPGNDAKKGKTHRLIPLLHR